MGRQLPDLQADIAHETGFTAVLAVENDIYAQYVHVVFGSNVNRFNVQPGTRRLLGMSGTGWALLAVSSDEHVARTIHRTNLRLKPSGSSIDTDYVKARVQESRKNGYVFSRGVVTEGIGIIALGSTAITPFGTRFAVGVGGDVDQLERAASKVVPAMRERLLRVAAAATASLLPLTPSSSSAAIG